MITIALPTFRALVGLLPSADGLVAKPDMSFGQSFSHKGHIGKGFFLPMWANLWTTGCELWRKFFPQSQHMLDFSPTQLP